MVNAGFGPSDSECEGGSSSSALPATSSAQQTSTPAATKNYPTGTQNKYKNPDVLYRLKPPGSLFELDSNVHRFNVKLKHEAHQQHLVQGTLWDQHSTSKVFGPDREMDWVAACRYSHEWLWNKWAKIKSDNGAMQQPGAISNEDMEELAQSIAALPAGKKY